MTYTLTSLIALGHICSDVLSEKRLGAYLGYKINSIIEIAEQKEKFFQSEMARIIEDYAQKNEDGSPKRSEDGNSILIINDKRDECHQKVFELENLEIDWTPPQLTLEDLDKMDLTFQEQKHFFPFISVESDSDTQS